MHTEQCLICKGTGEIEHPLREDAEGRYYSLAEVKDIWLAELKAYCQQNKKHVVPADYAIMLINEIWQATYIALAACRENVQLKERLRRYET